MVERTFLDGARFRWGRGEFQPEDEVGFMEVCQQPTRRIPVCMGDLDEDVQTAISRGFMQASKERQAALGKKGRAT